ncbi:MAG: hypothetical protein ACLQJ0_09010 [Steroidobacteraceae bacterium]|jgi:hypothetical protein
MRHVCKALCLWLLLIAAQQGAAVHEVSHLATLSGIGATLDGGDSADRNCSLCPAFAQAVTPAFSHAFHIPPLVRADVARTPAAQYAAVTAAVPTPRSRGPPLSS